MPMQTCIGALAAALALVGRARCTAPRAFQGGGGIGFCLDQVPSLLQGTGFYAVSDQNYSDCSDKGYQWCPLDNLTRTWTVRGGGDGNASSVEYYVFSTCCTGKLAGHLMVDDTGVPTCFSGVSHRDCSRADWVKKLRSDLMNRYDFEVPPSTKLTLNPTVPGGWDQPCDCICNATSHLCEKRARRVTRCLVCTTSNPCSEDYVSVAINFFKIHTLQLQSSTVSIAAWLRQSWYDHRLDYDYQCYGGLESVDFVAEAGSLENSRIWTPDLELYNSEQSIWQGSLSARLATVYSCWDGAPSRGGCGYVFWSRPGLLSALVHFRGLFNFPFDTLSFDLEFAAWALDGRVQDIRLGGSDGTGIDWTDESEESDEVNGLTAGSGYQDYNIVNITSVRRIVFYPCCPGSPWPSLYFTIQLSRAQHFYLSRILAPTVLLTLMSFIPFWMDPTTGERLGFGGVAILTQFTQQALADSHLPKTNHFLLSDYVVFLSLFYTLLALLETAVVLYVYNLRRNSTVEALVPGLLLRVVGWHKRVEERRMRKATTRISDPLCQYLERKRVWHKIFFKLDTDFSKCLETDEVDNLAKLATEQKLLRRAGEENMSYVEYERMTRRKTKDLSLSHDERASRSLDLDEFVNWCEARLYPMIKDTKKKFYSSTHQRDLGIEMDIDPLEKLDLIAEETHAATKETNGNGTKDDAEGKGVLDSQAALDQLATSICEGVDAQDGYAVGMWQKRALEWDKFSRWTIPPIYCAELGWCLRLSPDAYTDFTASYVQIFLFYSFGVMVVMVLILIDYIVPRVGEIMKERAKRISEEEYVAHMKKSFQARRTRQKDEDDEQEEEEEEKNGNSEVAPMESKAGGRTCPFDVPPPPPLPPNIPAYLTSTGTATYKLPSPLDSPRDMKSTNGDGEEMHVLKGQPCSAARLRAVLVE